MIHLPKGFAVGADIGWLPAMEMAGFVFRNRAGEEQDLLKTLKEDFGIDSLRLRTWVNPSDHPQRGLLSAEYVRDFALRALKYDYRIMINFHYSDSWADPAHQMPPAAWAGLSPDDLVKALYDYTKDTMQLFADAGFYPEWVQVGNETNPGMLLPMGSTDDFDYLTRLYNAGYDAVKAVSPDTIAMIHLAEGNNTEFVTQYFDALTERGARYDMIGLSYYPYWLKQPYEENIVHLKKTLEILPTRYGKMTMLVETGGIDVEESRTHDMFIEILKVIEQTNDTCRGFFTWEPEGAQCFSKYALSAWREDGTPTYAMDAYRQIST